MCARYTLTTPTDELATVFEVHDPLPVTARYNIAPTQLVPVIGLKANGYERGLALLRWGFVPSWAKDDNGPKPVNARAETLTTKFRDVFRRKRCLIPATGFYEWRGKHRKKEACYISLADDSVFAFAGLWDVWMGGAEPLMSVCLITTIANELVRPVHDRMPVILPREHYEEWLEPATPEPRLLSLLQPYPATAMKMIAVGSAVNSAKNDSPECLSAA